MDYKFVNDTWRRDYIESKIRDLEQKHYANTLTQEMGKLQGRQMAYEGASMDVLESELEYYRSKLAELRERPRPRDPAHKSI